MGKIKLLSIVVPAYNEAEGIIHFHQTLVSATKTIKSEIIYVDDGSRDNTVEKLHEISAKNPNVKIVTLARNFGKEIALTAGINQTTGDLILTLDADGQHPVSMIKSLVDRWENSEVDILVGLRSETKSDSIVKRIGSRLFYRVLHSIAPDNRTRSGATDFRLISREVADAFGSFTEHDRMARGLIDWLGFDVEYFDFEASEREFGQATYSTRKLIKLALMSITSASFKPLLLSLYIGLFAIIISVVTLLLLVIDHILGDPLHLNATGSAYFVLIITLLVGIVLIGQGMIAFYLSKMYAETQNRPLYIVNTRKSRNIKE